MHQYGVGDVEKLLHLPRSAIRRLVEAGFVSPARGARNSYLFSFQDLIVLRTAQALAAARLPRGRITRSLKALRRQLPEAMPLSGLSICAVADRVVVKEGDRHWQADSGQYLLAFEVSADHERGTLAVIDRSDLEGADDAAAWFDRAYALESKDVESAIKAYKRVITADSIHLNAYINLGRLLHEAQRWNEAEKVYRTALKACGADALLLYNLGVLLEDMQRKGEAARAYEQALESDPELADGHYNLALLYEALEQPRKALRHMAHYHRLNRRK